MQLAVQLFRAGRFAEAEQHCREALEANPSDLRALSLLGVLRDADGAHREAADLFGRATRLEPASPDHWSNLGTALRAAGEFDEALDAYRRAAENGAGAPDFLLNVALLHIDRLEYGRARAVLKQAAEAAPRDAEVRVLSALCDYEQVHTRDAHAALDDWREFEGLDVDRLIRIGTLLTQLGNTVEAEAALREALRREPGNALACVRLSQLLERTNRVEEARQQLLLAQSAPRAKGELAEELLSATARLAERDGAPEEAARAYRELLALLHRPHERYHVLFPLARVLDEQGAYADALTTAARAHESQAAYLEKVATRFLDPAQQGFGITQFSADAADIRRWDPAGPSALDSPIFIVGFPRSGTTLLEQSLDAHPQLRSMDEQPFLQNAIDRMRAAGARYPEGLAELGAGPLEEIRQAYWGLARTCVDLQPGQRLVDKNPLNLLRLPAICRLFPKARIILAVRHPGDVLVSNYFQHYRAPEIAMMCRSFATLAQGYRRAFDFWFQQCELLHPAVLELPYEDLVADFPAQIRRVAEFIDVPWDEAMLRPGEHALRKGYISTPSYSQVVRPVNQKAVGRWRRYERELRPVMAELEPYLRRWAYPA